MTKILITGGAGAIGSNLANTLVSQHEVVCLDNLTSGHPWLLDPQVRLVKGDIEQIDQCITERDFTHVFHLAAFFANQNSVDHPFEDMRVNINGTLTVLEFARQCKELPRFTFASAGCSVYDKKSPLPLQEEYPVTLHHDTPYQISKMTGEMYCSWFNHYYDLPTVAFRFFNSYGPNEIPGRYRNVIPNFFWWAMEGRSLPITGTGHETRDFIFVQDLVAGLIAGGFSKVSGEVFNLGTSIETRVIDLATRINRLTGNKSAVEYKPRRDWDHSEKKAAAISKAREQLGWEPSVRIEEGLERTWAWFQDNRERIAKTVTALVA